MSNNPSFVLKGINNTIFEDRPIPDRAYPELRSAFYFD